MVPNIEYGALELNKYIFYDILRKYSLWLGLLFRDNTSIMCQGILN